jgi:hypothetical protein
MTGPAQLSVCKKKENFRKRKKKKRKKKKKEKNLLSNIAEKVRRLNEGSAVHVCVLVAPFVVGHGRVEVVTQRVHQGVGRKQRDKVNSSLYAIRIIIDKSDRNCGTGKNVTGTDKIGRQHDENRVNPHVILQIEKKREKQVSNRGKKGREREREREKKNLQCLSVEK